MNIRKTLILACVLIAAIIYILKVEIPRDEAKSAEGKLFASVQKEALQSIGIRTPQESFTLKNLDPQPPKASDAQVASVDLDALKKWEVAEVPGSELDRPALNALLTALMALELDEPLPEKDLDSNLGVYGLAEPALTLTIQEGANSRTLQFGKQNEYVSKRYVKRADSDKIYLVNEGLYSAATKGRDNFRNHTPVAFIDGDLKTLSITDARSAVTKLAMNDSFQWSMVEPAQYTASNDVVSSLTRDLRALRVAKYFDSAALADYGLDKPAATVRLEFKDTAKTAPSLDLRLASKKVDGKDQVFLAINNQSTVYQLDTNPLAAILKPVESFRETSPFRFATDQVVQLDFSLFDEKPITVLKAGTSWTVNSKPGDDNFVRALIDTLANVRAESFPTDNRDYGFSNPRLRVVVRLASAGAEKGITERTLVVGDSAAKVKNEDTRYYAAVDEGKEPFIISKDTLKAIHPKEEVLVKSPDATAAPAQTPASAVENPGEDEIPDEAAESAAGEH